MAIIISHRETTKTQAPRACRRGFALLIAVIFMSVMLTLGITLGSIAFKQQVLASGAIESQYAFYVADAALECGLYADQQQDLFNYWNHSAGVPPSLITSIVCSDASGPSTQLSYTYDATKLAVVQRLPFDQGKRCADVSVYKYLSPTPSTYIFAQGYDVPCATVASGGTARFVARGLSAHYASASRNPIGLITPRPFLSTADKAGDVASAVALGRVSSLIGSLLSIH